MQLDASVAVSGAALRKAAADDCEAKGAMEGLQGCDRAPDECVTDVTVQPDREDSASKISPDELELVASRTAAALKEAWRAEVGEAERRAQASEAALKAIMERADSLEQRYLQDVSELKLACAVHEKRWQEACETKLVLEHDIEKVRRQLDDATEAKQSLQEKFDVVSASLQDRLDKEQADRRERAVAEAAEAKAAEERLSEMHGGAYFKKIAFHRKKQEMRFVRLTFDLSRVEWGTNDRDLSRSIPVASISRVDFGEASRAFRCCEFLQSERPEPGRCLTIASPARTLDLIAKTDRDVEAWVLGLNSVISVHPLRQRFIAQDFVARRELLRMESSGRQSHAPVKSITNVDEESRSNVSTPSAISSTRSWFSSTPSSLGRAFSVSSSRRSSGSSAVRHGV